MLLPKQANAVSRATESVATCDRTSQIVEWTSNLQNAIDTLDKALMQHIDRISSITREEKGDELKYAPEAVLVPLANQLRSYTTRVAQIAATLQSVTERVEL